MSWLSLFLLVLWLPQETFTRFTYCRERPGGGTEKHCAHLDPSGGGKIVFRWSSGDEVESAVALSPLGRSRFIGFLEATNFLAGAENYESSRRVADLGRKQLILETPSGDREAGFNYSEVREVANLVTFFDAILNQEMITMDLNTALQFERLSIPEKLERLEQELRANRIADPHALIPVLERIEQDSRVLNYARTHARQIKETAAAAK